MNLARKEQLKKAMWWERKKIAALLRAGAAFAFSISNGE